MSGTHPHSHGHSPLHTHHPDSDGEPPVVPMPRTIAPGVLEIDTLLGGWERVTAGYLIEGSTPVLIETGSQSSVPVLLAALDQIGVGPESWPAWRSRTSTSITRVVWVMWRMPFLRRRCTSTRKAPGTWPIPPGSSTRPHGCTDPCSIRSTGGWSPTEAARLHVVADGESIAVGPDRVLIAVDSPGHAKHHVGFHDSLSGVLFAGDAVGVKLPDGGVLRPATPPPDFDLGLALNSLGEVRCPSPHRHRAGALRVARSPRRTPGRGR